jgi:hypothetical protein
MNRFVRIALLGGVAGAFALGAFAITDAVAASNSSTSPKPVPTTSIVQQEPAGGTVAPTPVAPTPVAPTPVAPTPVAPTPAAPTPVTPATNPTTAVVAPPTVRPTPARYPSTDGGYVTVVPTPVNG